MAFDVKQYIKEREDKLRAEGLCIVCGKQPATQSDRCPDCRVRQANRNILWHTKRGTSPLVPSRPYWLNYANT